MSHSLAARTYAEQLRMHGFGEPLWQPEPPNDDGEVMIGDVGFIEDGRFYRLFNARLPADHPVNALSGVPNEYTPLEYNERILLQKNENYHGPTPIYSKSVSTTKIGVGAGAHNLYASYKFTCKSEKGAVLIPGDDITLWHVQRNKYFQEYVRLNHDSWHQLALAQGRIIEAEEIVLVTGFLKTSEWAIAALSSQGKGHAVSFSAQGAQVAQAEFMIEVAEAIEMSVSQRSGPKRDKSDLETKRRRDQCLFLKYYKAKRSRFLGQKIVANAEPQDERGDDDSEWISRLCNTSFGTSDSSVRSLILEEVPSGMSSDDPLDDILNYILQHSMAELAVVGHDDLYDLCKTSTWPDDFNAFLVENNPEVRVDEHKVGCLNSREMKRDSRRHTIPASSVPIDVTSEPASPNPARRVPSEPSSSYTLPVEPLVSHQDNYLAALSARHPLNEVDFKKTVSELAEDLPSYIASSRRDSDFKSIASASSETTLKGEQPQRDRQNRQSLQADRSRGRSGSRPQHTLTLARSHRPTPSPEDGRFPCGKCDQTFFRAYDRKRHYELVHAHTYVHMCHFCLREFSRPDLLKRHVDNGCEKDPSNHDVVHSRSPSMLMHWQLLPSNPSLGKTILFDMAFSVRRILKFVSGRSEPFEQVDRQKPAAGATQLASMTIVCHELRDWRVIVEKPGGVTCGDVFEALYASLNTALTPLELEQYVSENKRVDVEDAFAQRCEDLAARGKDVDDEVKRWIDLLRGRRMFAGLKVVSRDTWDLQLTNSIAL